MHIEPIGYIWADEPYLEGDCHITDHIRKIGEPLFAEADVLQLQSQLNALVTKIKESIEAYERLGEVTSFEGQPLIYAQVLLGLLE